MFKTRKYFRIFSFTITLITLFSLTSTAGFTTEIQGGVSFNVNSAREYLQDGIPDGVEIPSEYYSLQADNVEKTVYSYNPYGEVIGITTLYKGEPDKAYIYNKSGKLIYVDKYDKPVNIYPHRGYRYDLDGNLILSSLTVSKKELFRFSPDGKLIAHSINNVVYDENGKIIGRGK